jgi:hypothetical protein
LMSFASGYCFSSLRVTLTNAPPATALAGAGGPRCYFSRRCFLARITGNGAHGANSTGVVVPSCASWTMADPEPRGRVARTVCTLRCGARLALGPARDGLATAFRR